MKRLEEDAERYREQYIKYKELYKESKQYKEKYFQLKVLILICRNIVFSFHI